jgi:thioredoxin-dependent peroxiredoxin
MFNMNEKAPAFNLPNQHNQDVSLTNLKGKYVILYFYPKDNTPGCTRESVGFSDLIEDFNNLNACVYGVSKDSVNSHKNFCEKRHLKIDLLSDESTDMIQAYGVWQEKKFLGKTYMGIVRTTFLIDPNGTIIQVWNNVKVAGHAEAVLEFLKKHK